MDATLKVELSPEQKEAARLEANKNLANWYKQAAQLKELKVSEMDLRVKVVNYYFPTGLKEGTQTLEMPDDWKMKVVGSINRKIDAEAIPAIREKLKEDHKVDLGDFIKWKPELALDQYRELVAKAAQPGNHQEEAKDILKLVHQVMIVSDGSPALELVPPKKPKAVKTEV